MEKSTLREYIGWRVYLPKWWLRYALVRASRFKQQIWTNRGEMDTGKTFPTICFKRNDKDTVLLFGICVPLRIIEEHMKDRYPNNLEVVHTGTRGDGWTRFYFLEEARYNLPRMDMRTWLEGRSTR